MEVRLRAQLPELMKHLGLPMIAVEVGVASGLFSRDLLVNGIDKLYSVDAWRTLNQSGDAASDQKWHNDNYDNTVKLLTPFGERSIILRGLCDEMAKEVPDNSLGLVYLDGDHSYEGVMRDIAKWYPKLVVGGIISTHDYENPAYGTKKAFTEFANENGLEIYLLPENKSEDAGAFLIKK